MISEKPKFIFFFILLSLDLHSLASDINSVKIVFYYGPTLADRQSYDLDELDIILQHPEFIYNQTNCYMHGYGGSQEVQNVEVVVNSYLKGKSINCLTIDWTSLAGGSYLTAQLNLQLLAPIVADSFLNLFDSGLDCDSFSLVGHSLGGHGVGIIGREIFSRSKGNVLLPRITALDPSNPAVHEDFILSPIAKTDAKFVDVMHTDAGNRGSPEHMGDADFWPNGGNGIQPGCPAPDINGLCSHLKAYEYWAQSVANVDQESFLAFHATSYDDFVRNGTEKFSDTAVLMGLHCVTSARGDYFLQIFSDYAAVPVIGLRI